MSAGVLLGTSNRDRQQISIPSASMSAMAWLNRSSTCSEAPQHEHNAEAGSAWEHRGAHAHPLGGVGTQRQVVPHAYALALQQLCAVSTSPGMPDSALSVQVRMTFR